MLTLDSEQRLITGRHILFAGFGFVSLAGISILAASIGPRSLSMFFGNVTFYPASTSFILMMNGMMSICFWLLNLCLDSRTEATQGVVISFLKRQSTFSLTIYVAHHMAYVWPMQVMAWWNGKPDVWYYNNKFASPPVVILLAILFIVIFDRVLVLWSTKRRYSVEAILRWLSEP
jgi:hypothetical protein